MKEVFILERFYEGLTWPLDRVAVKRCLIVNSDEGEVGSLRYGAIVRVSKKPCKYSNPPHVHILKSSHFLLKGATRDFLSRPKKLYSTENTRPKPMDWELVQFSHYGWTIFRFISRYLGDMSTLQVPTMLIL